jgi:hypothetical protein
MDPNLKAFGAGMTLAFFAILATVSLFLFIAGCNWLIDNRIVPCLKWCRRYLSCTVLVLMHTRTSKRSKDKSASGVTEDVSLDDDEARLNEKALAYGRAHVKDFVARSIKVFKSKKRKLNE